jgi:hypothetical protein
LEALVDEEEEEEEEEEEYGRGIKCLAPFSSIH